MPLLLQAFIIAILIGLAAFLIGKFVPMSDSVKQMVEVGAVVVAGLILFVAILSFACELMGWSTGLKPLHLW